MPHKHTPPLLPDPTPAQLSDPIFIAIWDVVKTWEIRTPPVFGDYHGPTRNHVVVIYDAVKVAMNKQSP